MVKTLGAERENPQQTGEGDLSLGLLPKLCSFFILILPLHAPSTTNDQARRHCPGGSLCGGECDWEILALESPLASDTPALCSTCRGDMTLELGGLGLQCPLLVQALSNSVPWSPAYPGGTHSKTPSGCLKPRIVPNPRYTTFFLHVRYLSLKESTLFGVSALPVSLVLRFGAIIK